ncbi:hypothetical protein Fmac_003057 [Flemingia macrophylla]|uniref:F-box domain-containing protein n=1 Tax=Flemingia macrophylla TaxID=520843 RepID=A0ABD1NLR6_9FABA
MKKKKADHDDNHNDRISNLPKDVIASIMEYLPIQDVVKTSILSPKWRYTWTSVPQLEFTNAFFKKCKHLETSNVIITRVLLLHNDPIQKFTLCIPRNIPISTKCLNDWILNLSNKEIKILKLVNLQCYPFQTPIGIFSCQGLTHLDLHSFKLSFVPDFGVFNSLVNLHLSDIRFESNVSESLMLGCPSLVTLDISYCLGFECIIVHSPVLEVLTVQGDQPTNSICLKKAENLTHLALLADVLGNNFETDSNLIKGLSIIKSIYLGEGYIKMFSIDFPERLQGSLNCLKNVELYGVDFTQTRELLFVIALLESSPNLEKLLIESHSNNMDLGVSHTLDVSKYDHCRFNGLLTVNIIVKNVCNSTLNFIRILLAKSTSLEVLSFNIDLGRGHYLIPYISRVLQQTERASQRVEVEFIYDDLMD